MLFAPSIVVFHNLSSSSPGNPVRWTACLSSRASNPASSPPTRSFSTCSPHISSLQFWTLRPPLPKQRGGQICGNPSSWLQGGGQIGGNPSSWPQAMMWSLMIPSVWRPSRHPLPSCGQLKGHPVHRPRVASSDSNRESTADVSTGTQMDIEQPTDIK